MRSEIGRKTRMSSRVRKTTRRRKPGVLNCCLDTLSNARLKEQLLINHEREAEIFVEYASRLCNLIGIRDLIDLHHLYLLEIWKDADDAKRLNALSKVAYMILDTISTSPETMSIAINDLDTSRIDMSHPSKASFREWYYTCVSSSNDQIFAIASTYKLPAKVQALL